MFGRIANGLSIAAGIVGVPYAVFDKTGNLLYASIAAAVMALFLGIPAFKFLFRPPYQRRHGTKSYSHPFVVPKKRERVTIATDYVTRVSTEKQFLFLEAPREEDLVDTIEVLPDETIDEGVYHSSNSRTRRVVRKSDATVAIYWEPKTKIERYVPHTHLSEYVVPPASAYGPGYFWQGYHCDVDTGVCNWTFECPERVEAALAFKLPVLHSTISLRRLWRYSFVRPRRDCTQPRIAEDGRTVHWELRTPQQGRTYICIVVYEGGRNVFRAAAKARSL